MEFSKGSLTLRLRIRLGEELRSTPTRGKTARLSSSASLEWWPRTGLIVPSRRQSVEGLESMLLDDAAIGPHTAKTALPGFIGRPA